MGGDAVMYGIGYHFGHGILRDHPLLAKFLRPEREERVEQMFQQHGLKVLFVGRFLPGLRSSVYLAAGVLRVPFRTFVLFDLLCVSTVVGIFFFLAHRFATQIENMMVWIRGAGLTVSSAIAVALLILLLYYIRRRRSRLAKILALRRERADRVAKPRDIASGDSPTDSAPLDQHSIAD
jgi:membrane protein DedA with SNARE-associated domain